MCKGILAKERNTKESIFEGKIFFIEALQNTIPEFNGKRNFPQKRFLTSKEIKCLYEFALAERKLEHYENSKFYVENLFNYFNKGIVDENEKIKYKAQLLLEKIELEKRDNNYLEILENANDGIEHSLKYCSEYFLFFLFEKANALEHLGRRDEAIVLFMLHEDILREKKS